MRKIALVPLFLFNALILCLTASLTPVAIQAGDAPSAKLIIQSAVYGDLDNDKTADVKEKIVGLVKDENLSMKVDAAVLGNTAPGAPRKLKVGYTIDGIYHSKTVDEGETLDISARLLIRKAVYGNLPKGPSVEVTEDVTATVRKNSLSIKATNEAFGGDPAGGVVKKLRVDYTFDGQEKSKTVGENEILTISNKGE